MQIQRQIDRGADFLDLNVDEISVEKAKQLKAMEWLVDFVQERSSVPLCIDSSNPETIEVGLKTSDNRAGRTMLNSVSLERISALDLVGKYDACVIVTAAGKSGMPQDAEERVVNASRVTDAAIARGVALPDIYIDPLMFPISVDQRYGNHVLDAIQQLRDKYGSDIRITGGFSNVSFGLPCRKLINDVFTVLAINAGADSGIVDPVANDLAKVFTVDQSSEAWAHARALLVGEDPDCMMYLMAYRQELFADY